MEVVPDTNTCVGYSVECAHHQISLWGCSGKLATIHLHLDFLPEGVLGCFINQDSQVSLMR